MNFKLLSIFLVAALSACSHTTKVEELQHYQNTFMKKDIHVFLNSFSDHRQGSSLLMPKGEGVIDSYNPDDLTASNLTPILGYYIFHAVEKRDTSKENAVGINVSLRDVKTYIKKRSNAFSGKYGEYVASVNAKVILRDAYSNKIINSFNVSSESLAQRDTNTGRQPTESQDRQALLTLLDSMASEIADEALAKTKKSLRKIKYKVANPKKFKVESLKVVDDITEEELTTQIQQAPVEIITAEELTELPEMVKFEQAVEELKEYKKLQNELYDRKVLEQKWVDHLDNKQ